MPLYHSSRKEYWAVVSARIPPESKKKLEEKHPNKGEVSKILRALIDKYLEGRILGVRLET